MPTRPWREIYDRMAPERRARIEAEAAKMRAALTSGESISVAFNPKPGIKGRMQLQDFVIGQRFWTYEHEYICTDIGTRVVVAIQITDAVRSDPSWLNGPPYGMAETVMDEDDREVCYPTEAAMIADRDGMTQ